MDDKIKILANKVNELSLRVENMSKNFNDNDIKVLNEKIIFSRRKAFVIIIDKIKERLLREVEEIYSRNGKPWIDLWKVATYIFIHATDAPLGESISTEEFLSKIDNLKDSILKGEYDKYLNTTPEQLIYDYFHKQENTSS